jgi:lysophospholipase L1-like esterase
MFLSILRMAFSTKNNPTRCLIAVALSVWMTALAGCGSSSGTQTSSRNNPPVSSVSSSAISSSSLTDSGNSSSASSRDALPVIIAPDDSRIRYIGRVSVDSTAALYDWANIQIEFRVRAAHIDLLIDDHKNDYNLFVNGQLKSTISGTGNATYPVMLGEGEHHVLLTKRTGPNFGSGQFLGLGLPEDGQLLDLPPAPARKIEFIGDSYTVGYGNEGPGLDCNNNYRPFENSYLAFAPIAARALGAQSHSIAISGFGVVRNYADANTTSATPVPFYYNRTVMERPDLEWNFASWIPDAVVIKLGTNDHSTQPLPPADIFVQGVHGLIAQVTSAYGQVPIFLMADTSYPLVITRMQTAAQQQLERGNNQVYFVQVISPPQSEMRCDWHPSIAGHQAMATELVTELKLILGW